jgi:hypothetical protein
MKKKNPPGRVFAILAAASLAFIAWLEIHWGIPSNNDRIGFDTFYFIRVGSNVLLIFIILALSLLIPRGKK